MSTSIPSLLKQPRILVIPKQIHNIDYLASAFAVAQAIKATSRHVSIYLKPEIYNGIIKSKLSSSNLSLIDLDSLRKLIISVEKLNAEVQNIHWVEKQNKLEILIDGGEEMFNEEGIDIKLKKRGFDTTIMLGFTDPKETGDLHKQHPNFFDIDKTIVISKEQSDGYFTPKHYPVFTPTLAQSVYYFLKEFELADNNSANTLLLAALYWATDNFRQHVNSNTFSIASQMVTAGADINEAVDIGTKLDSLTDSRYYSALFANIKSNAPGIYYSVLDVSVYTNFNLPLSNNLVPFSKIHDADIAFAVLKYSHKNRVVVKSNKASVNLLELLADYNGKGDQSTYQFWTDHSADEICAQLTTSLIGEQAESESIKPELKIDKEFLARKMRTLAQAASSEEKARLKSLAVAPKFEAEAPPEQPVAEEAPDSDISAVQSDYDPLKPAESMPEPIRLS